MKMWVPGVHAYAGDGRSAIASSATAAKPSHRATERRAMCSETETLFLAGDGAREPALDLVLHQLAKCLTGAAKALANPLARQLASCAARGFTPT